MIRSMYQHVHLNHCLLHLSAFVLNNLSGILSQILYLVHCFHSSFYTHQSHTLIQWKVYVADQHYQVQGLNSQLSRNLICLRQCLVMLKFWSVKPNVRVLYECPDSGSGISLDYSFIS